MPVASIPACLAADQQGVAFRGPVRYPHPRSPRNRHPAPRIPVQRCPALRTPVKPPGPRSSIRADGILVQRNHSL